MTKNEKAEIIEKASKGEFEGGQVTVYGLKEGGVGIAPTTSKNVPKDVLDFVEAESQKIINGEVTLK